MYKIRCTLGSIIKKEKIMLSISFIVLVFSIAVLVFAILTNKEFNIDVESTGVTSKIGAGIIVSLIMSVISFAGIITQLVLNIRNKQ